MRQPLQYINIVKELAVPQRPCLRCPDTIAIRRVYSLAEEFGYLPGYLESFLRLHISTMVRRPAYATRSAKSALS